ncbi:MAG: cytochrome c-type biogenesis protein CcmH [bacterium]
MRYKNLTILILSVFLGCLSAVYALPQQVTLSEIKKSLVCQCDCNMTVEACQGAMSCDTSEKLTAEAAGYVEQGMNKEAILAAFVQKYGEHILAAPPKKGFNLTAWILPFAAILFTGFGIVVLLKRWARQPQTAQAKPNITEKTENNHGSRYEEKLDEALRSLD